MCPSSKFKSSVGQETPLFFRLIKILFNGAHMYQLTALKPIIRLSHTSPKQWNIACLESSTEMCNVSESMMERLKAKFMEQSFTIIGWEKSWQNYFKSDFIDIPNVACIFNLKLLHIRKREEHVLNTTLHLANDIIFSHSNATVRDCISLTFSFILL